MLKYDVNFGSFLVADQERLSKKDPATYRDALVTAYFNLYDQLSMVGLNGLTSEVLSSDKMKDLVDVDMFWFIGLDEQGHIIKDNPPVYAAKLRLYEPWMESIQRSEIAFANKQAIEGAVKSLADDGSASSVIVCYGSFDFDIGHAPKNAEEKEWQSMIDDARSENIKAMNGIYDTLHNYGLGMYDFVTGFTPENQFSYREHGVAEFDDLGCAESVSL